MQHRGFRTRQECVSGLQTIIGPPCGPHEREIQMNALPQQLFASQKASLDNFFAIQGAMLNGFEKLVDLNVSVLKASFDEISQKSRAAIQVGDAQEAIAFSTTQFQPDAEKALAYGRRVYDVLSGVQVDVTKLTEAGFAQFQQQVSDAIDQLAKNAPAGSESAVALLKSSLASANSAYETAARSARQAAEAAESNLTAAADATVKAARDANAAAAAKVTPAPAGNKA